MLDQTGSRPPAVRAVADESGDLRIRAVLEVLGGHPRADVAARWAVDPALLDRWVSAFVEAGTAQVTNRPVGSIARQRDRFLDTFLVGLRGPLAVAQGWVGLLGDLPHDPDAVLEAVGHLQDTLDQLADRTVDVELITAAMLGRVQLDAEWTRLADLTGGMDPPAVFRDDDAARTELLVDPALFSRILRDLWVAAHTAGPRPRAVRLEVEAVHPWVEVRVVRDGEPVEPAALHRLFEPFEGSDADARVTVGLYLARALTVVHGGTVGLQQDERHTVFAVRVPDARPRGPEPHQ